MKVKDIIVRLCPNKLLALRSNIVIRKRIASSKKRHANRLSELRNKDLINVCFFAVSSQAWKCDGLYHLMEKDPRFNPTVLVCPIVNYGKEDMLRRVKETYETLCQMNYNIKLAYDAVNEKYIDVRKELNPDIIVYTNPYKGLIDDRYYIDKFNDKLTIYIPYFFTESRHFENVYNLPLHNLVWRFYTETSDCFSYAKITGKLNKDNMVCTGYPGIDQYLVHHNYQEDPWKIQDRKIKRIIWAPHHTIDHYLPNCDYSTFLEYYDFMLELAKKYSKEIQIAYKPHPILRNRLYLKWGKQKTDAYYEEWNKLNNGFLCDSLYQDLFLTSDAIMHDCGSFISEYMYTGKPALHLHNGIPYEKQYNETAIQSLNHYYKARNKAEIEQFILNIINGVDPLKEVRLQFIKEKLMPPNMLTASENIFNDIVKELYGESCINTHNTERVEISN